MSKSIGMIEFTSIAKGIETCDIMLKSSQVSIVKSCTVCPGKYIIIVSGDTSAVKSALEVGKKNAGEHLVDSLEISSINHQLIPALNMTNQIEVQGAVGVLEFYSIASAVLAGDIAAKAANVSLVEIKIGYAIGGKGVVIVTGDVGDVTASFEAVGEEIELLCGKTIIPRPSKELFETLL